MNICKLLVQKLQKIDVFWYSKTSLVLYSINETGCVLTEKPDRPRWVNIKSGGIGIDITPSQDAAPCRFPKINRARLASFIEGEGGRALAPATIIWT